MRASGAAMRAPSTVVEWPAAWQAKLPTSFHDAPSRSPITRAMRPIRRMSVWVNSFLGDAISRGAPPKNASSIAETNTGSIFSSTRPCIGASWNWLMLTSSAWRSHQTSNWVNSASGASTRSLTPAIGSSAWRRPVQSDRATRRSTGTTVFWSASALAKLCSARRRSPAPAVMPSAPSRSSLLLIGSKALAYWTTKLVK